MFQHFGRASRGNNDPIKAAEAFIKSAPVGAVASVQVEQFGQHHDRMAFYAKRSDSVIFVMRYI